MPEPYLCPHASDPAGAPDKVFIDCAIEQDRFAPAPDPSQPPAGGPLRVVAWNLERGMHLDAQLALLQAHPDLADADVLLLSEADRGCSRTHGRNVTRELARALERDCAFGVQYVELPRRARRAVNRIEAPCEHGNAILSRVPLEAVRLLRHRDTARWYERADEPRLGGCATLTAEIPWGAQRVRLYAVHLDSGWSNDALRASQAADLVADAADHAGPVVIGGDLNCYRYTLDVTLGSRSDPTPRTFLDAGYQDAHAGLVPWRRRGTTGRRYGVRGVIDLIFARGLTPLAAGIVRGPARGLSDHLPVWSSLGEAGG